MKRRGFIKAGMAASLGSCVASSELLLQSFFSPRETKIPIIDTHVHLWDLQILDYPWLETRDSPLSKNFLVPDFQQATYGCDIKKIIFVECGRVEDQYLEEVDWVVEQAKKEPRIKGMVAYLPIEKGEEVIPEIEELTSRKITKGIRHGVNKELIGNSKFVKGIQLLPQYDLSFDLNLTPSLMQEAVALIKRCPKTIFILDHLCNPNIKGKEIDSWKADLMKLSEMENVFCKISGIITKADPEHWNMEDIRPYIGHALETFGPNRVLFGGDWPVVLLAGSYQDWFSAFRTITNDLTFHEKEQLYYKNAEKAYRV